MIRSSSIAAATLLVLLSGGLALAQSQQIVLDRDGGTIALEPYAPNIIRVTLSLLKEPATAAPGYGFVANPSAQGWSRQQDAQGDVYRSPRLVVSVAANRPHKPMATELDIAKFFNGSAPPAHIIVSTPAGKKLAEMTGWSMSVPNHKDGNASVLNDKRPSDPPFYQVGATFVSPDDEHYYGLGQNHEGFLDHRGRRIECWHNYTATAAPSMGVPFLVTNKGYGVVWDNPSKTVVEPGFNEETRWTSEVGDRVSFFVIAGDTTDEIYAGYRQLTGTTPMLPKAAYGFIQCKQRYASQDEVLAVAKGYRDRHLPLDVIVVDWFYWTKMGQIDMDPGQVARSGRHEPPAPRHGNPDHDQRVAPFHARNPLLRFPAQEGLVRCTWPTERPPTGCPTTAPAPTSIPPTRKRPAGFGRPSAITSSARVSTLSGPMKPSPICRPTAATSTSDPARATSTSTRCFTRRLLYDGFRRDMKHRALILSRDAYLGAQRNGTMFWSSDIYPTWDTLKRQVPTGLDFTATGIAYWGNDIGGWQYLPPEHHPAHPPLLDPSDARDNVGGYDDYPELYTRWFEYGAFLPIFRTHGSRLYNEVWTYGKAAEPILEKYLKLRYQLMPYIYSLGYHTHESGAPYMRALFMDFPNDPNVAALGDEYMFGPAFLVAPVTDQGATSRSVYLPAGADWYNYWTNQRIHGGQTIQVNAPIDTLPLFVRAGSILPLGEPVESTRDTQKLARVRVYPGADADFTLYDDDGTTYAYENGDRKITRLHWNDAAGSLSHEGFQAWTGSDTGILEIVGR